MNPHSRNRRIRRELDALLREEMLTEALYGQLVARYGVAPGLGRCI